MMSEVRCQSLPTPILHMLFSDYHTHPQGHRVQRYTRRYFSLGRIQRVTSGLTDIAFTDHDRYHAGIDFR